MCGQETNELTVVETEGTELEVCSNCKEFGTVVEPKTTPDKEEKKQGKNKSSKKPSKSKSSNKKSGGGKPSDMMDQIETLAGDYNDIVRDARESRGLTQKELSNKLNEKMSLIKKIEGGDMRPDEDLRRKLESELDVSLTMEITDEDWEGGGTTGEYTLGDLVERKDE